MDLIRITATCIIYLFTCTIVIDAYRYRFHDDVDIPGSGERHKRFLDQPDDPVHWLEWASTAACSVTCGGRGFKERTRDCSTGQSKDCENQGGRHWDVVICEEGACGSAWLEWGPAAGCSVTCGFGVQTRLRSCSTGSKDDCTGKNYDLSVCNPSSCTVSTLPPTGSTTVQSTSQPAVPEWSAWTQSVACSVSCGTGYSERLRSCSTGNNDDCGGGQSWSVDLCDAGDCKNDGEWGSWDSWGSCSATCGGGNSTRSRACNYPDPTNKGDACLGYSNETEICNDDLCPIDGVWSNWGSYAACSETCGDGVKIRQRACVFLPGVPQGQNCSGTNMETTVCNDGDCPVDGSWTTWSSWAPCTKSCHGGIRFKARVCVFDESKPHGKDCDGNEILTETCNTGACVVDGAWGEWLSWTQCSHTCGGGLRSHSRSCMYRGSAAHGKNCGGDGSEIQDCGQDECPVDGSWGTWGGWAQCSRTCGGGFTTRHRNCTYSSPTAPHAKTCPGDSLEAKTCSATLCPVDAIWSEWTRFSDCSVSCGNGERVRSRTCIQSPVAPLGIDCYGSTTEKKQCKKSICPVDGSLTAWAEWSKCSASCSGGTQARTRQCHFPAGVPHGSDCVGKLTEKTTCNELPCPTTTMATTTTTLAIVDGHWSDWSNWTECTASCGTGTQEKTRFCTYPDHTLHGQKCPGFTFKAQPCNTDLCPVDGVWSQWSLYGRCSVTCGNGTRTRNRDCVYSDPLAPQGDSCVGTTSETDDCFSQLCPVDGSWSSWLSWSSCSATCGGGNQTRQRTCEFQDGYPHGIDCAGDHDDMQECSTDVCPVDGVLGLWTTWTTCTATCGGGVHARTRTCDFQDGIPHGLDCQGVLNQTQGCKNELCPVDGHWSDWQSWSVCTATCGGGNQNRHRTCIYDDVSPHGSNCTGPTDQSQKCSLDKCPVDGHFSVWSDWGTCTATCGNGTHDRSRSCVFVDNAPRGNNCSGSTAETEDCNKGKCPEVTGNIVEKGEIALSCVKFRWKNVDTCEEGRILYVDGVLSVWSPWSPCTVSCGNGTSQRNRSCDFPPDTPHGADCTGTLMETTECGIDLCPIDGVWGAWSNWTMCTVSCGGGLQQRDRSCDFDPVAPHGIDCTGNQTESRSCEDGPCPVDGIWSEWSNYSNCSRTCGSGTQYRTRQCYFKDGFPHGENCTGSRSDASECSTNLCPVDGQFSLWSDWTVCTKSCNNGTKTRNRTCDFPDGVPHGVDCQGDLNETSTCHEDPCPIDGHWSEWSNFTVCSVSCAGGRQDRNRTCIYDVDVPHGAQCFGNVTQEQDCQTTACPVDGVWGAWQAWIACSVTCGGGQRARRRECVFQDGVPHGQDCVGNKDEVEACSPDLCEVDGQLSQWSGWTPCSVTCDDGVRFSTRQCEFDPVAPHGKNCTGDLKQQQACTQGELCPVDGFWQKWGRWGRCTQTCDGGTHARRRNCFFPPGRPNGEYCVGMSTDRQKCNEDACAVDGLWGSWSGYSGCSATCGGGTQTRLRNCTFPDGVTHGNPCVGQLEENIKCNVDECPQDAVWSVWTAWAKCSFSCGNGTQTRNRTCDWPSTVHGNNCTGDSSETQTCTDGLCPVDGSWGNWDEWSACSVTCNIGTHSRQRNCTYDPVAPQGTICVGENVERQICTQSLCAVDGQWTSWQGWGACSVTCGNGTEIRSRQCSFFIPGAPHGKDCTGADNETRECDSGAECPVDGNWGSWKAWSQCSTTCGAALKNRSRECLFDESKPHGFDCFGSPNETEHCRLQDCPVDGVWNSWSLWTNCSDSCGGGSKLRNRTCVFTPDTAPHGTDCAGNATETMDCNTNACPVDGVWDAWASWSACSVTCGDGFESRNRTCLFTPDTAPHGQDCMGNSTDSIPCNLAECAVDGVWDAWASWSACSVTCGDGFESRNRTCLFTPDTAPHGQDCMGNSTDSIPCNLAECAVDGVWDAWASWSACSVTCGDGFESRNRTCLFTPATAPHGQDCMGNSTDSIPCNLAECAVDGVWDAWASWSACSVTCGDGFESRNRTCLFTPATAPHGQDCMGNSSDSIPCNLAECAVDGVWDAWASWSACSVTCGDGFESRNRTCLFTPDTAPHGQDCMGNSTDSIPCNLAECAVDGVWDAWASWSACSVTCGDGFESRNRTCLFTPATAPHGQDCMGNSSDSIPCNLAECAVDGVWDAWASWSACSVTCGDGFESRNRTCLFTPDTAPHGQDCMGNSTDSIPCNLAECAVDGVWDAWASWSACSVTCGDGFESRNRTCLFTPDTAPHGQDCMGNSSDSIPCNLAECAVDGVWDAWASWSACSVTCGDGFESRNRTCLFTPDTAPHGQDCMGNSTDSIPCNLAECAVDGVWDAWASWSACSVTCGDGFESRNRTCLFTPATAPHGQDCMGNSTDSIPCNLAECAVDGVWDAWASWSACSVTCGDGFESRNRTCLFTPDTAPHGQDCMGNSTDSIPCNLAECAVDGVWDAWASWSACSVTCGDGFESRNRTCLFTPDTAPHGQDCMGNSTDSIPCNLAECAVDGVWDAWASWSACSVTCGDGFESRNRACLFTPDTAPHGQDCMGNSTDSIPCNLAECAVDGVWDAWASWSACSVTCGDGFESRNRTCLFTPDTAPHGQDCMGNSTDSIPCNLAECAVDGVWSDWSSWSQCSVTCAEGFHSRTRDCYFPPSSLHGKPCSGSRSERDICSNGQACAADPVHNCFQCIPGEDPLDCDILQYELPCEPGKNYCINNVTNDAGGNKLISRTCGTLQDCYNGWYRVYSNDEKCVNFDENAVYLSSFYCEFCCSGENCNDLVNMPNKYNP